MANVPSVGVAEGSRVTNKTGAGVSDDSVTGSDVTVMDAGDAEAIAGEGVASYMEGIHDFQSTDGRRDKSRAVRRVVSAFYSDSSRRYNVFIANRNMFVILTFLRHSMSLIPSDAMLKCRV